jgi:hypothetical protein
MQVDRTSAVTKPTGPLAPLDQWGQFRNLRRSVGAGNGREDA